jgi:pSer/pThr/pTyr-binding forkhead associated (FHA) protein
MRNRENLHKKGDPMDKLTLLMESLPKAMLQALNPETKNAVPQALLRGDMVMISKFPYKIGRESRVIRISGRLERVERLKKDDSPPNNDLYLVDRGEFLNISREHCQIEKNADGYLLVDRGSACGTKVGGTAVGGDDQGGSVALQDGDIIAVGSFGTPYLFRFISFDEYCLVRRDAP